LAEVIDKYVGQTAESVLRVLDAIEGKHSVLSFDEAKVLATRLLGEPEFDIDGQVVRSGGVVDQIEVNASKIDTLYQSHQNGGIRAKLSAPTVALITVRWYLCHRRGSHPSHVIDPTESPTGPQSLADFSRFGVDWPRGHPERSSLVSGHPRRYILRDKIL
jgi:hypothetical protein